MIGSQLTRLTSELNVLRTTRENEEAAKSRIIDVDVAEETASLTRTQILQQAAAAILSHANQEPVLVLKLLEIR